MPIHLRETAPLPERAREDIENFVRVLFKRYGRNHVYRKPLPEDFYQASIDEFAKQMLLQYLILRKGSALRLSKEIKVNRNTIRKQLASWGMKLEDFKQDAIIKGSLIREWESERKAGLAPTAFGQPHLEEKQKRILPISGIYKV